MNRRSFLSLIGTSLAGGAARAQATGADWPHWRGPARSGLTPEGSGWRDGAPWPGALAWRAGVGAGAAPPVIAGGRVYTLGFAGGQEIVAARDAATGAEVWKAAYPAREYGRHATGDEGFYRGPSACPEVDAGTGRLFTLGIDGELSCWDTRAMGRRAWGFNLYERFKAPRRPQTTRRGASQRDYGYTAAPLLQGGLLLVEVGSPEGTVMAFDPATGEPRWASRVTAPAGHSGGLAPLTIGGVPCVAAFTALGLLVVRTDAAQAGATVAEYEWATDFANNIASLATHEDTVLMTSAYNRRAMVRLRVRQGGADLLWRSQEHSGVCSPVIHQGHVYFANRGLHCLDLATGEEKWVGGRFGDAASCAVTGDGRVVIWANNGDLALAETAGRSPNAYRELAAKTVLAQTEAWPHLALARGRVYCKDRSGTLVCFAL